MTEALAQMPCVPCMLCKPRIAQRPLAVAQQKAAELNLKTGWKDESGE
jgi:hypothetical protein